MDFDVDELEGQSTGDRIKRAIGASSYSVRSLAAEVGLHQNTLYHWIHGRRSPSMEALAKIWRVLADEHDGLRIDHLIDEGD